MNNIKEESIRQTESDQQLPEIGGVKVGRNRWIKALAILLGGLAIALILLFIYKGEMVITVSQGELQELLDKKFPLNHKMLGVTLQVATPQVILKQYSDQIKVTLQANATYLQLERKGEVVVHGQIDFQNSEGIFYWVNPKVESLSIEGLPSKISESLLTLIQTLLEQSIHRIPVYRLKDDIKGQFAKGMIKRISVSDGAIHITLK